MNDELKNDVSNGEVELTYTKSFYLQAEEKVTIKFNVITDFNVTTSKAVSITPITSLSMENAFPLETGSTKTISFNFVRNNPENCDDEGDDSSLWSNKKWYEQVTGLINRWQMRTNGCTLRYNSPLRVTKLFPIEGGWPKDDNRALILDHTEFTKWLAGQVARKGGFEDYILVGIRAYNDEKNPVEISAIPMNKPVEKPVGSGKFTVSYKVGTGAGEMPPEQKITAVYRKRANPNVIQIDELNGFVRSISRTYSNFNSTIKGTVEFVAGTMTLESVNQADKEADKFSTAEAILKPGYCIRGADQIKELCNVPVSNIPGVDSNPNITVGQLFATPANYPNGLSNDDLTQKISMEIKEYREYNEKRELTSRYIKFIAPAPPGVWEAISTVISDSFYSWIYLIEIGSTVTGEIFPGQECGIELSATDPLPKVLTLEGKWKVM